MTGNEKTKREHKEPEEMTVDELEKGIDDNSMRIGLTVADIFKTLSLSMLALPNMELKTGSMDLTVKDDSISVTLKMPKRQRRDPGFDEDTGYNNDDDNDEEGMLYDEI